MNTEEKEEFITYKILDRTPMIWGVPFMFGLFVFSGFLLIGSIIGLKYGPAGWFVAAIAIPILIFTRSICATDDRAISILLIELKWFINKKSGGNDKYYGGTLAIAPTTYQRKLKYVKRYFEKTLIK